MKQNFLCGFAKLKRNEEKLASKRNFLKRNLDTLVFQGQKTKCNLENIGLAQNLRFSNSFQLDSALSRTALSFDSALSDCAESRNNAKYLANAQKFAKFKYLDCL